LIFGAQYKLELYTKSFEQDKTWFSDVVRRVTETFKFARPAAQDAAAAEVWSWEGISDDKECE
jgi:hypothetical protein